MAPVMREKMHDLKVPVPVLESRQMADLLAFLTAYRYYLAQVGEPGSPARGRQLFEAKSCDICHGTPSRLQEGWAQSGTVPRQLLGHLHRAIHVEPRRQDG